MILAKVEINCPCGGKLVADPTIVCERIEDEYFIECCQCGRRYYLIESQEAIVDPLKFGAKEKAEEFIELAQSVIDKIILAACLKKDKGAK